jgi:hypothetical protein
MTKNEEMLIVQDIKMTILIIQIMLVIGLGIIYGSERFAHAGDKVASQFYELA